MRYLKCMLNVLVGSCGLPVLASAEQAAKAESAGIVKTYASPGG